MGRQLKNRKMFCAALTAAAVVISAISTIVPFENEVYGTENNMAASADALNNSAQYVESAAAAQSKGDSQQNELEQSDISQSMDGSGSNTGVGNMQNSEDTSDSKTGITEENHGEESVAAEDANSEEMPETEVTEETELTFIPLDQSKTAIAAQTLASISGGTSLQTWNYDRTLSDDTLQKITDAICAYDVAVSFTVVDINTGEALTYDPTNAVYSASSINGPYILSLLSSGIAYDDNMAMAITDADNAAYAATREKYGSDLFAPWLAECGVSGTSSLENYVTTSSLDLAKMWTYAWNFFTLDNENAAWARSIFQSTNYNGIVNALSGTYTIYSKGSYSSADTDSQVYNCAGIVSDGSHPYVMSIMTEANSLEGIEPTQTLALALDQAHREMVGLYQPIETVRTSETAATVGTSSGTLYKTTASSLNVRSGAGTGYSILGSLTKGTEIYVLQVVNNWGQINYNGKTGWVNMPYCTKVSTDAATEQTSTVTTEKATTMTTESVVITTEAALSDNSNSYKITASSLTVRSGPGTSYSAIGYLSNGEVVEIISASSGWGKINYKGKTGWISMTYCKKVENTTTTTTAKATTEKVTTVTTEKATTTTTENTTTATTKASVPTTTAGTKKIITYTYKVTASSLNVRTGPGTGYSRIGSVSQGTFLKISETSNGWGKFDYNGQDGWVLLSYCTLISTDEEYVTYTDDEEDAEEDNTDAGSSTDAGTDTEGASVQKVTDTYKVTASSLNVRTGPGTTYSSIGYLSRNGIITVLEISDNNWGKIDYQNSVGWVSLKYCELIKTAEMSVTELNQLSQSGGTSQLIIVDSSGSTAIVSYYIKTENQWTKLFAVSGYIGRNGIGKTKEGDGKTPSGEYHFIKAFGNAENPGCSLDYTKVTEADYWVDDIDSVYYNQFVSTDKVTKDWTSAEHLIDYPAAYQYALALDYNINCTKGAGSAIFLHCSTGSSTAGCIAIPAYYMQVIMTNVTSDCEIIIR